MLTFWTTHQNFSARDEKKCEDSIYGLIDRTKTARHNLRELLRLNMKNSNPYFHGIDARINKKMRGVGCCTLSILIARASQRKEEQYRTEFTSDSQFEFQQESINSYSYKLLCLQLDDKFFCGPHKC